MDIQVDEARKLGMRMTVTRGSMNLSVKDGGLPPDSVVQDEDTILADCERVIGKYHQRGDGRDDPDCAGAVFAVLGHQVADVRLR